jgi:hypothetical protein
MPVARNVWQHVDSGSPAFSRALFHHHERIVRVKRAFRELAGPIDRPEQELFSITDPGGIEIVNHDRDEGANRAGL